MRRPARQSGQLTHLEPDRLAVDDKVNGALEDRGDLVLRVLVLLPARPAAVAVKGRRELRGVDGGAKDVGTHLLEILLGPVDLLRDVEHGHPIIAYSLPSRLQFGPAVLGHKSALGDVMPSKARL